MERDLQRDHSLLLEEQLQGVLRRGATGSSRPTSFVGLLSGAKPLLEAVNEYGSLDHAQAAVGHPLQRFVSSIGRCVPVGVQLEQRPLDMQQRSAQPPPASRTGAPQQRQQHQQHQQPRQAAPPQPVQQQQPPSPSAQQAAAEVVPGTLKIRLKLSKREGSSERRSPPGGGVVHAAVLQTVRQLGAGRLLSPLPDGWSEVVHVGPGRPAAAHEQLQPTADSLRRSPEHTADGATVEPQPMPCGAASSAAVVAVSPQPLARSCSPMATAAAGTAAAAAGAAAAHRQAEKRPACDAAVAEAATGGTAASKRQRAAQSAAAGSQQRSAQQPHAAAAAAAAAAGPPDWAAEAVARTGDSSHLGVLAALLPAVLEPATCEATLPAGSMVQTLQEEGKALKRFAEKKMKGPNKPTHVSSMFLCQSCVKFLTVAATMEADPQKFSLQSTSSMYSQTASLLESCAHNAGRAEGPAMITQAISFLAARLAAVARLRAVHCLRAEGHKQMQAFRAALERASGETYQRPSPTDSNTSTAISVPVEASSRPAGTAGSAGSPPAPPEGRRSSSQPPARTAGGSADAAASFTSQQAGAAPAPPLVPLPKPLLERQLAAAQHSQVLLGALSSFSKTGQALREYMHRAAGQNNMHGLKVAAAVLLLSADAGMGPAAGLLSLAKTALEEVMQLE